MTKFPKPKAVYVTSLNGDHGSRQYVGYEQRNCEKCTTRHVYRCGLCGKFLCKNCHKWLI